MPIADSNWPQMTFFLSEAYLRAIFKAFDKDGNGEVSHQEMKEAFQEMGHILEDEDIQRLIDLLDTDHSGTVSYEEFLSKIQTLGIL